MSRFINMFLCSQTDFQSRGKKEHLHSCVIKSCKQWSCQCPLCHCWKYKSIKAFTGAFLSLLFLTDMIYAWIFFSNFSLACATNSLTVSALRVPALKRKWRLNLVVWSRNPNKVLYKLDRTNCKPWASILISSLYYYMIFCLSRKLALHEKQSVHKLSITLCMQRALNYSPKGSDLLLLLILPNNVFSTLTRDSIRTILKILNPFQSCGLCCHSYFCDKQQEWISYFRCHLHMSLHILFCLFLCSFSDKTMSDIQVKFL